MAYSEQLAQHFSGYCCETTFVARSFDLLNKLGFTAENCIACVGRCRDELTQPLLRTIQATWGSAFDFAALGGLFFAGTTGLEAVIAHAPTSFGRQRYLFFAFAHIGVNGRGDFGRIIRPNQTHESSACGALSAFQKELVTGSADLSLNPTDLEQSLLKQRLAPLVSDTPDLVTLTKIALQATLDDLETAITLTVDPTISDYAVLTGIQLHTNSQQNYIWPFSNYATIAGQHHTLNTS